MGQILDSNQAVFKKPVGAYEFAVNGAVLPPDAPLKAGTCFDLRLTTLCETEDVKLRAVNKSDGPVWEWARRMQIAASIQHATRRGCVKCRDMLIATLTTRERREMYSADPSLGPVVGIAGHDLALLDPKLVVARAGK